MEKEVELILSKLKIVSEAQERGLYLCDKEHSKLLLDYITNLQQENERLKTKTKEQSLLLIDYQDMEQKLEKYKSRIEKAVEYLKQEEISVVYQEFGLLPMNTTDDLLNILNGRSNE